MPETRTLSRSHIRTLYQNFAALDGYHEEVPEGEQKQPGKLIPYKLGKANEAGVPDPIRAAKVRSNIIKNLTILGRHDKHLTKASDSLLTQISGGTGTLLQSDPQFTEKLAQYNTGISTIAAEEVPVDGLLAISVEDLNLHLNEKLAMTTVAALDPLVVTE